MDEGMRLAERCNALIARLEQRGFTVRMHYEGENQPVSHLWPASRMLEITVSRYTDPAVMRGAYHLLIDWLNGVLMTDSRTGPEATTERHGDLEFSRTPTRQEVLMPMDRGMRL